MISHNVITDDKDGDLAAYRGMDAPKLSVNSKKLIMDSKRMFSLIKGPRVLENGKKNYLRITKEEMAAQNRFNQIVFPMCLDDGREEGGFGRSSSHTMRRRHNNKPLERFERSRANLGKRPINSS